MSTRLRHSFQELSDRLVRCETSQTQRDTQLEVVDQKLKQIHIEMETLRNKNNQIEIELSTLKNNNKDQISQMQIVVENLTLKNALMEQKVQRTSYYFIATNFRGWKLSRFREGHSLNNIDAILIKSP